MQLHCFNSIPQLYRQLLYRLACLIFLTARSVPSHPGVGDDVDGVLGPFYSLVGNCRKPGTRGNSDKYTILVVCSIYLNFQES